MLTLGSEWTRWPACLTLMLLGTGCATAPTSDSAICAGTAKARQDHSAALVDDGGPRSLVTGANLIATIDAGCK